MYYGTNENQRIKQQLITAFFQLLKKYEPNEITITQLTKQAHTARSSFYRNFQSKAQLIEFYLDQLHDKLTSTHEYNNLKDVFSYEQVVQKFAQSLTVFLENRTYVLLIYQKGYGLLLLQTLDRYIEESIGNMPANSIDRYQLYFLSGASFNVLIHWLTSANPESPQQLALTCANYLTGFI